jgi:hypothetical protein
VIITLAEVMHYVEYLIENPEITTAFIEVEKHLIELLTTFRL